MPIARHAVVNQHRPSKMSAASCEGSDETQIKSVLIKERYYRDTSQFEKMRDTYHPDGSRTWVNISW